MEVSSLVDHQLGTHIARSNSSCAGSSMGTHIGYPHWVPGNIERCCTRTGCFVFTLQVFNFSLQCSTVL